MAAILYVETNLILGIAKGHDVEAARFVEEGLADFQIVIPSVCYMEALSAWMSEQKRRNAFLQELEKRLREEKRDKTSPYAIVLSDLLERFRIESEHALDHINDRLNDVLDRLSRIAYLIDLNHEMIQDSLNHDYIDDPADNLILCTILHHARSNSDPPKAFLSSNSKDFGKPGVVEELKNVGVSYLRNGGEVVGWVRSLPRVEPDSSNP